MNAMRAGNLLVVMALAGAPAAAQKSMSPAEIEEFLKTAKLATHKTIGTGVTQTERATLKSGDFVHDAHVQSVDITKAEFKSDRQTELNFRDTYKFNIAAYRLCRLLGLNMMPVSVERKIMGKTSAVTWWIDDAMMEGERIKKKIEPPDQDRWNKQMYAARVFDELIYDTDPNLGNFLIDKNWKLWMVDKTRAFRLSKELRNVKNLTQCDRSLLAAMKKLDENTLLQEMKDFLSKSEVKALLARRDKIVAFFDKQVAEKGENQVLYDLPDLRQ